MVLILSYSGESDEILRMLSVVKKLGNPVVAITSTAQNALARHSDLVLKLGRIEEAAPRRLALIGQLPRQAAQLDSVIFFLESNPARSDS